MWIEKTAFLLPIIVTKQNIYICIIGGCISWKKWINIAIIIKWMRIKGRQMINPNAIRSQQLT